MASVFLLLRNRRDCGSVRLSWVSLVRLSPLKLTAGLLFEPDAGGGGPSLGTKLLSEAHARTSVPSTEKCSEESSPCARAWATTPSNNTPAASCSMRRSRFLENVEGTHGSSSIATPTNQRNSRL